ncbi:titin homolog isoform X2 [Drosophila montana]|uniref:titin homolog isoform X2 n=1 Tax=Drosophila montana TaxID=40370 RepID=UPI00313C8067
MQSPALKKDSEAIDNALKSIKEETGISDTIVVSQEEAKKASSTITDVKGVQETCQSAALPSPSVEEQKTFTLDVIPNTRKEQISNESNTVVSGNVTDVISTLKQKSHNDENPPMSKVDQKETEKENKKQLQQENPSKVKVTNEKIPATTTEEKAKTNDKKRTNFNAQKGKQNKVETPKGLPKPGLANGTQPKIEQQKERDDKLLQSPEEPEITDTEKEDQTLSANVKTIEKSTSDTTTNSNSVSSLISDTQNQKELFSTFKSDSNPKLLAKQIKDISVCEKTVKKEIDDKLISVDNKNQQEITTEKEDQKDISLNEKSLQSKMEKDEAKKDDTIKSDLKRKLKVDDQKERDQNNIGSKKLKLMDDKNIEQTQPQQPKPIQMPIIKGNEKTFEKKKVAIEAPQTTKKEHHTKAKEVKKAKRAKRKKEKTEEEKLKKKAKKEKKAKEREKENDKDADKDLAKKVKKAMKKSKNKTKTELENENTKETPSIKAKEIKEKLQDKADNAKETTRDKSNDKLKSRANLNVTQVDIITHLVNKIDESKIESKELQSPNVAKDAEVLKKQEAKPKGNEKDMSNAIKKTDQIVKATIAHEVSPEQSKTSHEKKEKNNKNVKSLSNNNIDPKQLQGNQQHLANQNVKKKKRAAIKSGNSTEVKKNIAGVKSHFIPAVEKVIQKECEQTHRETELQDALDLNAVQSTTLEQKNLSEQANRQLSTKQNVVIKKLETKKEDVKKSLSEVDSAVIPVKKEASEVRGKFSYGKAESQGIEANYLKPLASKNSEQKLQSQTADRRASVKKNDKESVEQSRKEEDSNQTAEMTKKNATDLNSSLISTAKAKAKQKNNEHKLHRVPFDRQILAKHNDRKNEPVAQKSLPNTNYPVNPAAQQGKYEKPEPFKEIIEQVEADDNSLQFLAHKYNDQQHFEAQVAQQLLLKQQVTRKEEKIRDNQTSYETMRNVPNIPFAHGVKQGTHQEYQHVDKTVMPLASKNNDQQLFQQQVDAKALKLPYESQMQESKKEDGGMQTFLVAKQNDMPDINNIEQSQMKKQVEFQLPERKAEKIEFDDDNLKFLINKYNVFNNPQQPVDRQTLLKPGASPLENKSNDQTLDGNTRVNDQPLSLETGIKRSKSNTKVKQTLKQGNNRKNGKPLEKKIELIPIEQGPSKLDGQKVPKPDSVGEIQGTEIKAKQHETDGNVEKRETEKNLHLTKVEQVPNIMQLDKENNEKSASTQLPAKAEKRFSEERFETEAKQYAAKRTTENKLDQKKAKLSATIKPEEINKRQLKRKLEQQTTIVQKTPIESYPTPKKVDRKESDSKEQREQPQQPSVKQQQIIKRLEKKTDISKEMQVLSKKEIIDRTVPVDARLKTDRQAKPEEADKTECDKVSDARLQMELPLLAGSQNVERSPNEIDSNQIQSQQPIGQAPDLDQKPMLQKTESFKKKSKVSAQQKVTEANLIPDGDTKNAEKRATEKNVGQNQTQQPIAKNMPNIEEIVRKMEMHLEASESSRKLEDQKVKLKKNEPSKDSPQKKKEFDAKEERKQQQLNIKQFKKKMEKYMKGRCENNTEDFSTAKQELETKLFSDVRHRNAEKVEIEKWLGEKQAEQPNVEQAASLEELARINAEKIEPKTLKNSPQVIVKPDAKVERKQQQKIKNKENKMEESLEKNTEKKIGTDMNPIPDEANKSAEKRVSEMELGQKHPQKPSANDALNLDEIARKKEMSPKNRELKRKLDDQKPNLQKMEILENPPLKKIKSDAKEKRKKLKPLVKQPIIKKPKKKTKCREEGSENNTEKVSGEKKAPAAKKKITETEEMETEKKQSRQPNVNQASNLEAIAKKIELNTENIDLNIKLADQKRIWQESETLRNPPPLKKVSESKEEQQQEKQRPKIKQQKEKLDNLDMKGACENNTEDISATKKESKPRKISTEAQKKEAHLEVARIEDIILENKELKRKLEDHKPQFQKTETLENPPQKKIKSDAKEKQKEQKPPVRQPEIEKLKNIENNKEERSENNTEKVSADEETPKVKKKGMQTNLISDEASEDAERGGTDKKMGLQQQRVDKEPNLEEIVGKMDIYISNSESDGKLGDQKTNSQKTEAKKGRCKSSTEEISFAKKEPEVKKISTDKGEIVKKLELKEAQQPNVNQVTNLEELARRIEMNQENVDQTPKVEQKTEGMVKKPLLDAQLKSESHLKPTETHKIATNIPSTPKLVAPNPTNHPENQTPPTIPLIKKLENNVGIGFFERTATAQKRSSDGQFKMETSPKSDEAHKAAFDMPTIPRRILPVAQKPMLGIKDLRPKRAPGHVSVSKPFSTTEQEVASKMPRPSTSQSPESNETEANKTLEELASNVTNTQNNDPINQQAIVDPKGIGSKPKASLMPDINAKTESAPKKSHKPEKNAKEGIASNKIPGDSYSQVVIVEDKGIGSELTAGLRADIKTGIASKKSHKPGNNAKKGITSKKNPVGASSRASKKVRRRRKSERMILIKDKEGHLVKRISLRLLKRNLRRRKLKAMLLEAAREQFEIKTPDIEDMKLTSPKIIIKPKEIKANPKAGRSPVNKAKDERPMENVDASRPPQAIPKETQKDVILIAEKVPVEPKEVGSLSEVSTARRLYAKEANQVSKIPARRFSLPFESKKTQAHRNAQVAKEDEYNQKMIVVSKEAESRQGNANEGSLARTLSSRRTSLALESKSVEANRVLQAFKDDLAKLAAERRKLSKSTNSETLDDWEPYKVKDMNAIFRARIVRKGLLHGRTLKLPTRREAAHMQPHLVDEDEMDLEEIGVPDSYEIYWPSNLHELESNTLEHPDEVVERSTLLSLDLPKMTYKPSLSLSPKATDPHRLSDLQLEAIIYACQAHEQILPSGQRAGFLLGDGAGVGKGRTLAAIIYENFQQGRNRALWISVSEHLRFEVERELNYIGVGGQIKVEPIGKFKYNQIIADETDDESFTKGIICSTYTELTRETSNPTAKYETHVSQLAQWLGKNGIVVLDECHKANRMSLSNTERFIKMCSSVLKLQQMLPMARIVYASATGAAEPRNMVYMTRLGLWGMGSPYAEFLEFVNAVEKRGSGAMEIVAVDMKLRGIYVSRQLSLHNVNYRIEQVPMSREFRKFYNYSAELWAKINEQLFKAFRRIRIEPRIQDRINRQFWSAHQRYFKNLCIAAKLKHVVKMANDARLRERAVVIGVQSTSECRALHYLEFDRTELTGFVSTAKAIIQSFIENYFPAPSIECFERLLRSGAFDPEKRTNATGGPKRPRMTTDWSSTTSDDTETSSSEEDEDDGNDAENKLRRSITSKAEKTMHQRILKHLCNNMKAEPEEEGFEYNFDGLDPQADQITESEVKRCISARDKFLLKIQQLSRRMPPNTVDKIIADLGGPSEVAELTKRRGRVVKTGDLSYKYELRGDTETNMDMLNYAERQAFMDDRKKVAIISEAASSGISLHSDQTVANQRQRLYISLELPWSAERAIQQFGCTKRTNQKNEPEYVILISDVAAELHQANMVAMELKNLGAIDSNPPEGDPFGRHQSLFNLNNSIGSSALDSVLQQITGKKPLEAALVPDFYKGDFSLDCCEALAGVGMLHVGLNSIGQRSYVVNNGSNHIPTFLNRLLGCRLEVQTALFKFFLNKMYAMMLQVKRTRHFNMGITDLDVHGSVVTVTKLITFRRIYVMGTASTELHTVEVERGLSFDAALTEFKKKERQAHEGFYILRQKRNNNNCAILCLNPETDEESTGEPSVPTKINLVIIRPNTGAQVRTEPLSSLLGRYVKASPKAAQPFWDMQFSKCLHICSHIYWSCKCSYGKRCGLGLRVRSYHVLSGLLISVWERVANIIEKNGRQMQMVRVKTESSKRIVGILVPEFAYRRIVSDLSCDATVETKDFTRV